MFKFLARLFKPSQPVTTKQILDKVQVSDMIEITLKPWFCRNMIDQTQERFSKKILESAAVSGIVVNIGHNPQFDCLVIEVMNAEHVTNLGWVSRVYTILEDEMESVRICT